MMCLIIDQDVAVDRRDGTVLRADVYRPDSREIAPSAPVRWLDRRG